MSKKSFSRIQGKEFLIFIILFVIFIVILSGYFGTIKHFSSKYKESISEEYNSHVYWKEVECTITELKPSLFGYSMEVYNKDYNLLRKFHLSHAEMERFKNNDVDDVISCILYSQVVNNEVTDIWLSLYNIY